MHLSLHSSRVVPSVLSYVTPLVSSNPAFCDRQLVWSNLVKNTSENGGDGFRDGSNVGFFVVGSRVGLVLGLGEGGGDGAELGLDEGGGDGTMLGADEGEGDGWTLGLNEGESDGAFEGSIVSISDGV